MTANKRELDFEAMRNNHELENNLIDKLVLLEGNEYASLGVTSSRVNVTIWPLEELSSTREAELMRLVPEALNASHAVWKRAFDEYMGQYTWTTERRLEGRELFITLRHANKRSCEIHAVQKTITTYESTCPPEADVLASDLD
jgi:hypothetical protein